jgi:signal transduction histidine kinase
MNWKGHWVLCLGLLLFAGPVKSDTILIYPGFKVSPMPLALPYFNDISYQMSPDFTDELLRLRKNQWSSNKVNFGYTKGAFWFQFVISNTTSRDKSIVISLENTNIDSVNFYANYGRGYVAVAIAGDHVPTESWTYPSRQPIFPLTLEPYETVSVLVKARNSYSGNMILPFRVWQNDYFRKYQQGYNLIWGFYLGFLLLNFALALFAIIFLKSRIFIYYAGFLAANLFYSGYSFGFMYQFFTGHLPGTNDVARTSFLILISIFMLRFSQSFLRTKAYSPNIHKVIYGVIGIQSSLLFSSIFIMDIFRSNFNVIFPWFLFFLLTGYGLVLTAAIQNRKILPLRSKAYLVAIVISLAGSIILILADLNVIAYTLFTSHAPWIGNGLEIFIFTAILLFEFKVISEEKIKLEQQIADAQTQRLKDFFRGQEKERERIARDLHDNVAGSLVGARFLMPTANQLADKLGNAQLLAYERALHTLDRSIHDVRNLSHNLQPPALNELSLQYELERLINDNRTMSPQATFHFTYRLKPGDCSTDEAVAIYRVCQECLLNVFKHAEASSVHLMLERYDDRIKIYLTDNGVGFNTNETGSGIGLQNIRSRLAFTENLETHIESEPGKGTQIFISFKTQINKSFPKQLEPAVAISQQNKQV